MGRDVGLLYEFGVRANIIILVAAMGFLGLAACEEKQTSDSKAAQAAAAQKKDISPEAKEIFNSRCATCHGTEGKGNGPAAAALNPKPRNTQPNTPNTSVTDCVGCVWVFLGGAAVGKSPIMPASPDLESNQAALDGLVGIVRGFGN